MKSSLLGLVLALGLASVAAAALPPGGRVIDTKFYHLGDSVITDWPQVSPQPHGLTLEVKFTTEKNEKPATLALTYWDLNFPAILEINGRKADDLPTAQKRKVVFANIPAGLLQNGENTLRIRPTSAQDDWAVGKLVLYPQSFGELMGLQPVKLTVTDGATGQPVPARITIADRQGQLQRIFNSPTNGTAVRLGLIYTGGLETTVQLAAGEYMVYATRGMEWSRDKQTITVRPGKTAEIKLTLHREVDTRGFVAADTHIHTLTFSGHGDASIEERMVTLAGEGVELAVATDHNHQTDYRPYQEKLALNQYFTPVTGNEVSTKVGHITAFPFLPGGEVPDHKETNWIKLAEGIRAKGAKVVILNHPTWPRLPIWENIGLNALTGERTGEPRFPFDGMELLNSGLVVTNIYSLCRDWFALLNYGEKVLSVGSSDSHAVGAPVGQGRSYIRSATDDPAKINVDEACEHLRGGDVSVSYGIFCEARVENRFQMGQIVPVKNSAVTVQLRVAAPSWVKPRTATVFLNGQAVAEQEISPASGKATDRQMSFSIPAPRHDAYLVCVVLGDPVTEPCWPTGNAYTLAASNPIYLDANNDGRCESPRETALHMLAKAKTLDERWREIEQADNGVAVQMLDLMNQDSDAMNREKLRHHLQKAAPDRGVYREFLEMMRSSSAKSSGG